MKCAQTSYSRFRLPLPVPPYIASFNATTYGLPCPQKPLSINPIVSKLVGSPPSPTNVTEDCEDLQMN